MVWETASLQNKRANAFGRSLFLRLWAGESRRISLSPRAYKKGRRQCEEDGGKRRMGSKSKRQSFLEGAVILAVSTIVVKALGALFKVPLMNLLGGTGWPIS